MIMCHVNSTESMEGDEARCSALEAEWAPSAKLLSPSFVSLCWFGKRPCSQEIKLQSKYSSSCWISGLAFSPCRDADSHPGANTNCSFVWTWLQVKGIPCWFHCWITGQSDLSVWVAKGQVLLVSVWWGTSGKTYLSLWRSNGVLSTFCATLGWWRNEDGTEKDAGHPELPIPVHGEFAG